MSDTTDSGADPWGLPEESSIPVTDSDDAKEDADLLAPEAVAAPDEPSNAPASPIFDVEFEPAGSSDGEEAVEPDAPSPAPSPPESRGPLSQVLAASGLFGGTPVPHSVEPAEEEEEPQSLEDTAGEESDSDGSIDVAALELAEVEVEPPDLSAPAVGSIVGIGATDADLPSEPPPWMVSQPPAVDPDEASRLADFTQPAFSEESVDLEAAAALDEAAAAFAEISFVDDAAQSIEVPDFDESAENETAIDETQTAEADLESLVAELAVSDPGSDEEIPLDDVVPDITIDPADTPSVYRELEALTEIEPAAPAVTPEEAPIDEVVETSGVGIEKDPSSTDQLADAVGEAGEAVTTDSEWAVFEYADEPSEPDAPVFGVTFGKDLPKSAPEDVEDLDAVDLVEDEIEALTDIAEAEPDELVLEADRVDFDSTEADVLATSEPAAVEEPAIKPFAAAAPALESPAIPSPEEPFAESTAQSVVSETAPIEWGSRWQESAQGWVEDEQGRSTWRPIVTTSPILSEWQIDTYLGVVAADVVLGSGPIEVEMPSGRTATIRALVDEAMARGAHAIVGVSTTMASLGGSTVLTATGTAVTLKAQD
ncbi:MAG: heavy metal-binding domain-containing protein [Acidimicrobiia bacterium]|nr:heavy metal-binding domain-containing protein [Acidimicrobiia bacterium]